MTEPKIEWKQSGNDLDLYVDGIKKGHVANYGGVFKGAEYPYVGYYYGFSRVYTFTEEAAKETMEWWALSEGVKGE